MVALRADSGLADDLELLAAALEAVQLEPDESGVGTIARNRDRLARSIRSYLIPRLQGPGPPLMVVVAGPTGSGKSTLINSLSGREVSATGPIRPTTSAPVVLASTDHAPGLSGISGVECQVLVGAAPILSRMALVDTPDIDSVSVEHRAIAEILIDNADVVVFVTSALRYADLVPWEVLRRAVSRGATVINVLNRITPGSAAAVHGYRGLLAAEGLDDRLVRISEHHIPPGSHRVPGLAVRELQRRLVNTALRAQREGDDWLQRVLDATVGQALELADDIESRRAVDIDRVARVTSRLREAARTLDVAPLLDGIAPPAPSPGLPSQARWRWRHRVGKRQWIDARHLLQRRVLAMVEMDLRSALLGLTGSAHLDPARSTDLRAMTGGAVEAWLGQLAQLSGAAGSGAGRLRLLVLAEAATRGTPTAAFDILFDQPSLLVRAYRALIGRLEVVYDQMAAWIEDRLGLGGAGNPEVDRLREMAASVVARSHFADV